MGLLEEIDALNCRRFSSTTRAPAKASRTKSSEATAASSKKPSSKARRASPKPQPRAKASTFALAEGSPAAGKGKAKAIVVDDESSEAEPEAALTVDATPHSSTPVRRKAKASTDEAPPIYSEWTLEDLQGEARRFGFKSSRSRRTVISQLQAVWEALHPIDRRARLSGSPSPFDDLRYRAGAQDLSSTQPSFGILSSDADIGDLTMQLAGEGGSATSGSTRSPSRSPSPASSKAETDPDGEDLDEGGDAEADAALEADPDNSVLDVPSALSSQIAEAVRDDAQLWHRILLMEPISFDEVSSVVRSKGVTGIRNKEVLRSWLDRQGICVYFGELTGSRTRY